MNLGITGGIGSGKTFVTELLEKEYGFEVLRTDSLAEELMLHDRTLKQKLTEALGPEIYLPDGKLNRSFYAALLCNDAEKRRLSDSLVHPAVWKETERRIREIREKTPEKSIAVETALPGTELQRLCPRILFVSAEPEIRTRRLMETRGYSRERAEATIALQPPEEEYLSVSTDRISNNKETAELRRQLEELL